MRVFIVLVLLTTLANAGRLRSDLLHSLKTSAKDLPGFEAKVNNFLDYHCIGLIYLIVAVGMGYGCKYFKTFAWKMFEIITNRSVIYI